MNQRFICASLSLLMLILAGCQDTPKTPDNESTPSGDTAAVVTEDPFLASLPDDLDFGGMEFCIGRSTTRSDSNECTPDAELTKGEIVDDAVRLRNSYVEDRLNISITSPADDICGWTEFTSYIQPLIMAGDTTFDVFCANTYGLFQSSLNGLLLPMQDIETLDLGNPWWDTELISMSSFGSNTVYFASGAINYFDDYASSALLVNTKLCRENNLELPYQAVLDGKWTLDMFSEYCKSYSADLNGDGVYDEADAYGLICNMGIMSCFCSGSGTQIVVVADDGSVSINQEERIFNVFDKLFEDIIDPGNNAVCVVERKLGYDVGNALFPQGQSLFYVDMVSGIDAMRRKMEDDFGIVPIPKFDEAQTAYYSSYDTAHGTAYAIPTTQEEPDTVGYILDVMGFYSEDTIYPAVIEKNILVKGIRDEESAEMLDIIFHSKFYELGQWGSFVYDELMGMCKTGTNKYASKSATIQKRTQKEFASIADYYDFD